MARQNMAQLKADHEAGDFIWIDASLWDYDEETCPFTYESNPPEFNLSVSPTDPDYAKVKEEGYIESRRQKEGG